jgi:hypothetical protein
MRKDNFDPDAMAKAGRERAALELDDLRADWVSAFKIWALSHGATGSRELNDLSAEFQLQNIELPFDQVREEQCALVEEMRKVGSDNSGVAPSGGELFERTGQAKRLIQAHRDDLGVDHLGRRHAEKSSLLRSFPT